MHWMIISASQFEILIVLLHYHLLQVSVICNIYIYVPFCVTNTRDFRATNNIVIANWKVGESSQNTKVVCLFYISVHCIHIPIDLAWDKTVRKPLQLFYCNCHSNHDSLIGVLSPRNSYRGDKVMDRSCVSKWGSVRLSRFDLWAWYSQQPLSLLLFVLTRSPLCYFDYTFQYLNSKSISLSVLTWQYPLIYICIYSW